jgi:hypothetical protein
MDKIIMDLIGKYHIRRINDTSIGIIASYKSDIEEIGAKYNLMVSDFVNMAGGLCVWARLTIK